MQLLERDSQLVQLQAAYGQVVSGDDGLCAVLSGDAGIGKTSLVQVFLRALPADVPVLLAGCDELFTPRPLGPVVDLAGRFPPSIAQALEQGRTYTGLFPALLRHFKESARPCVFVVEDVHWADVGTLDLLRYLGRRLHGLRLLMLLTHRGVDLHAEHPLRNVLGDLPASTTLHLELQPLSRAAVERLASSQQRDGAALYTATAGNPFYVTSLLAAEASGVPPSVRDTVRAALARLPAAARALAEWVSLFPGRVEHGLLERVAAPLSQALDDCLRSGLLNLDRQALSFRHEIARQAIYEAMPERRRVQGHAEIYSVLAASAPPAEPARLVHHAEAAGLTDQVAALAPLAARKAAATGSHREAARLYGLALRQHAQGDAAARAELLEAAAREFQLVGAVGDFMQTTAQALALRRQTHDAVHIGMNLRLLAFGHWALNGARDEAQAAIIGAIEGLNRISPCPELALALAQLSRLQCAWSEFAASMQSGDQALALAEVLGDDACLVEALHACAAARMFVSDDAQALARLQRALAMALSLDLQDASAQLYRMLQMVSLIYRHHAYALEIATQGIAYCEARDLDVHKVHLLDNQALSQIELGRWADADHSIMASLALPGVSVRLRNSLLFLRARLHVRRGDTAAQEYWRELQAAPDAVPMGYRLPAIAAACAEAAWLRGEPEAAGAMAAMGAQVALAQSDARLLGPLLVWLHRLQMPLPEHSLKIAPEHASELAGDVAEAAQRWAAHGCVYERALALLHGDQAQLRQALEILSELEAAPAAEIARTKLRALGARDVPRGPQPRTRDDPLGLTAREREVFELAREGLSFAAIAQRLHRSERTVEHHVAAVYRKLGVGTRAELMARHPVATVQQKK